MRSASGFLTMSRWMRPARRLALAGLTFLWILSAAAQNPQKDASVWVVDDTVKVHPITGSLLLEDRDVHTGQRAGPNDYRRRNSVWDADTNTVKLFAGRNEFVSFQIVIEKKESDLHKVFVDATDLIGSAERISADRHVRLFKQLYLEIDGNWYPDALVPFDISGVTPMELPDLAGPLGSKQKTQAVWVDIYVPHELPAGRYTGEVAVLHRATNKLAKLKVELEVAAFILSDELHLDVNLMNYGFLNIERGWPDLVLDSPRHRAIEKEFFRMAHEHRMTFAVVPYNHDGSVPKGQKPVLEGVGDGIRVSDWSAWDARYGPVLSGDAFRDLPRTGQPVGHFFLPYNLMWPSDMRNWQSPVYRAEYVRVGALFREHLARHGWTKPQYQIYYNHKESYGFFPWNLDEPTRQKDVDALRYLGGLIKEAFPVGGPVKVLNRLDIGHFFCRNVEGDKHPNSESERVIAVLGPSVDLWNINSPHYWANLPEIRKFKAQGKVVYFYSGTPHVTKPLLQAVFWGWHGYKYESDGICFWDATDWTDWDTDAAPKDPYTNAGGRYRGFSMIFYPGAKFGYDGPIPSLRLKAMRRGLQDFEYLRLAEKMGLKTRQELIALADALLFAKEADYPKLRRSTYDLLSKKR